MNPNLETARIKDALRELMRHRGLTLRDLAEHLGVSLATVKRILGDEELSLSRLLAVLDWLGISLADLEAMIQRGAKSAPFYSEAQELFLAADPRYLVFLDQLYAGQTPAQVAKAFGLSARSTAKYLLRLEQNGLIRVSAKGQVAPVRRAPPFWIARGPLARAHYERVLDRFAAFFQAQAKARFAAPQDETSSIRSTVNCEPMSERTYRELQRELREVIRRYADAAALEKKLEGEPALGKVVLLLCHSWYEPERADELTRPLQDVFGGLSELD